MRNDSAARHAWASVGYWSTVPTITVSLLRRPSGPVAFAAPKPRHQASSCEVSDANSRTDIALA